MVLDFFATWCQSCIEELPELAAFWEQYRGRGARFFMVNVGEPADTVAAFVAERKVDIPILLDRYQMVIKKYAGEGALSTLPLLYVIGADGTVAYSAAGRVKDVGRVLGEQLGTLGIEPP